MGYNIVGLIPGQFYNTSKDRILFVGAHWDTYGLSPGFDDNGSGVAAVLEAARVLAAASCYRVSEIEEWNNNSKKKMMYGLTVRLHYLPLWILIRLSILKRSLWKKLI